MADIKLARRDRDTGSSWKINFTSSKKDILVAWRHVVTYRHRSVGHEELFSGLLATLDEAVNDADRSGNGENSDEGDVIPRRKWIFRNRHYIIKSTFSLHNSYVKFSIAFISIIALSAWAVITMFSFYLKISLSFNLSYTPLYFFLWCQKGGRL